MFTTPPSSFAFGAFGVFGGRKPMITTPPSSFAFGVFGVFGG
jgi:hypothetical protein